MQEFEGSGGKSTLPSVKAVDVQWRDITLAIPTRPKVYDTARHPHRPAHFSQKDPFA